MDRSIGARLYQARKAAGYTRKEVGIKMSLHETTIKRYEDGHFKGFPVERLKEFADILDVDVMWLWGKSSSSETIDISMLTDKEKELVKNYIGFIISQRGE